jgi:hypothetical protein
MNEIKVGDIIELKDEHREHIQSIKTKMENAQTMMNVGSATYRAAEKELWDFIHDTIPETKGMDMNLNHEKHIINITGKLRGNN